MGRDQKNAAAVQPSYDFTGLWKRDLRGVRPYYEPPAGWPYTPLAQAIVDGFNENQNPQVGCEDPGPPKYMILPYPIQISRPDDKTIVIAGELRAEPRVVYLDRTHPPKEPSALGHSVGWFEGTELVVETTNFNPQHIFRGGLRHFFAITEEAKITERFTRISNDQILYRFFVEDFDMYSNVWAGEMPFRAVDDKIYEYACHEGNYAMANILAGAREEDRRK